jgi:predicted TIM-barrel fold metal-dependent hydrolase
MDKYSDYIQVLTFSTPPVEIAANPEESIDLARRGNDELAELIAKYPSRFIAGVANLPMNDIEAALKEADRAVKELALRGVLVYSNINGKPLDSPESMPLYQKMAEYDLPIWIHPRRDITVPDYTTERFSKYKLYGSLGWPYETQLAMSRLVCNGVLERYPNIKFITHHCGGGMPFLGRRVSNWLSSGLSQTAESGSFNFAKEPIEYFRMFYGDTANIGDKPVLECGYAFFGASHMLFGTDMPFGRDVINEAIGAITGMSISNAEKKLIFEDNARKLLHLSG